MTVPVAALLSSRDIAARSGSSFLVSFLFLSRRRREALTSIYAFCRVADDAVDEAPDPDAAVEHLEFWRTELEQAFTGSPSTGVGRALQRAVRAYQVPIEPLRRLIEGVAMDIEPSGYPDLEALEGYCSKVASAVGLACLPVFGVVGPWAERYAERLGLALQLTNVLRDLKQDAEQGRVYVPRSWLQEANLAEEWLAGSGPEAAYSPAGPVAALTVRLCEAAATRFGEAAQALRQLPRRDRRRLLPARIMGAIYADLLVGLRRRGGDLRVGRLRLGRMRKLWLALRTVCGVGA